MWTTKEQWEQEARKRVEAKEEEEEERMERNGASFLPVASAIRQPDRLQSL